MSYHLNYIPLTLTVFSTFIDAVRDMELLPNNSYRVKVVENNVVYTLNVNRLNNIVNIRCYERYKNIDNHEKLPAE